MNVSPAMLELASLGAALAATGLATGLLAGLFGIGGGAVMVPVMYQALQTFGFPDAASMKTALGTSLAVIIPTSIRSFQAHRARGAVDTRLLKDWLIPVPAGVALGALVAAAASGAMLRAIFAVLAFLMALRLILNREHWRLAGELPGGPVRALAGAVIGVLATLMGVGGGVFSSTFMTLYGRPIHQAVATAAGVGILIAVPGALGYVAAGWGEPGLPPLSLGYVSLIGLAIIMPLSLLTAPVGVRLAHRLSKRRLEMAFGVFLLAVAARFGSSVF